MTEKNDEGNELDGAATWCIGYSIVFITEKERMNKIFFSDLFPSSKLP